MKKKIVSLVLVFALALALGIGGTVAWLTAQTGSVVNTFTVGDINITLDETTGDNYPFVPGDTKDKDPKVTIEPQSEACYVFVKVVEANNIMVGPAGSQQAALQYEVADDWTPVTGYDGIYWIKVDAADAKTGKSIYVLEDNTVTASTLITETDGETLEKNPPVLTFTAYAIQSKNVATEGEAEETTVARLWADNFANK